MSLKDLKNRLNVKIRLAKIKAAKELALIIPEIIRLRTQQEGEGLNGPLDALEPSTVKYRERYSDNLSPDTTPPKSNLTATGQLMESIKGRNVGSKIIVEPTKAKRKKELSGGKSKATNREVRKWVEQNGREFLELTKEERQQARELAEQIIRDELRSVIK